MVPLAILADQYPEVVLVGLSLVAIIIGVACGLMPFPKLPLAQQKRFFVYGVAVCIGLGYFAGFLMLMSVYALVVTWAVRWWRNLLANDRVYC